MLCVASDFCVLFLFQYLSYKLCTFWASLFCIHSHCHTHSAYVTCTCVFTPSQVIVLYNLKETWLTPYTTCSYLKVGRVTPALHPCDGVMMKAIYLLKKKPDTTSIH